MIVEPLELASPHPARVSDLVSGGRSAEVEVPFSVPAPIIILPSCPYVAATLTHASFSHQLTLTSTSSPPPHHSTREAPLKRSKPAESGASACSQPQYCCEPPAADGPAPDKLLDARNGNASERVTNKRIKREEVMSVGLFVSPEKERSSKTLVFNFTVGLRKTEPPRTDHTTYSHSISHQHPTHHRGDGG